MIRKPSGTRSRTAKISLSVFALGGLAATVIVSMRVSTRRIPEGFGASAESGTERAAGLRDEAERTPVTVDNTHERAPRVGPVDSLASEPPLGGRTSLAKASPKEILKLVVAGWTPTTAPTSETALTSEPPAAREPNNERGRSLYEDGAALYNSKDYQGALASFQEAFAAAPHWKLRYNIAQVDLQLDHLDDARHELEGYLAEGGERVSEERRQQVEEDLERIARHLEEAPK